MFTTRLISGIILVLLAVFFVGQGGLLLFAVTALISLIGLFELYRVLKIETRSVGVVGYITALSYYGILWWEGQQHLTLMIILSLMAMMSLYVFTFPKYKTEEITGAFFGVCYVPVMLSFLYQTREMQDGACGLADFSQLLGMRHLRLLQRDAFRKAQTGSGVKPQKIHRGRCGRYGWGGSFRLPVCLCVWGTDERDFRSETGVHRSLCDCSCNLSDR